MKIKSPYSNKFGMYCFLPFHSMTVIFYIKHLIFWILGNAFYGTPGRTLVGDEIRQGMLGGKVYINRAQGTHNDCNNYNGRLVYIASWGWAIPGPVDSCFVFKQRASWSIGESEDIPVTPTPPALLFCDDSPFLLIFCDDFPPFPFNFQLSCSSSFGAVERHFI